MKVFIYNEYHLPHQIYTFNISIRYRNYTQSGVYSAIYESPFRTPGTYLRVNATRNGISGYTLYLPICIEMNCKNPTKTIETVLKAALIQ